MTSGAHILIRPAGPADAAALAELRFELRSSVALVWEPETEFLPRCTAWMAQRLMPGGWWRSWVAVAEGKVVGNVWLQLFEKIPNPGEDPELHGYISNLIVAPSHRGAGIGSRLLTACIASCNEEVVDKVILWPTPESRSLYARHGFAARDDIFARRADLRATIAER